MKTPSFAHEMANLHWQGWVGITYLNIFYLKCFCEGLKTPSFASTTEYLLFEMLLGRHQNTEFRWGLHIQIEEPGLSAMGRNTSSTAQGGGGSFKNRKPIGGLGCCESRMAERSHWWTEGAWSLSLSLFSLSIFFRLSTYLPTDLSVYLSIYLSVCLSIYLSVYLSIYITSLSLFHLSICLVVYLSIHPSIYLSVYLSVYLSTCLSVVQFHSV